MDISWMEFPGLVIASRSGSEPVPKGSLPKADAGPGMLVANPDERIRPASSPMFVELPLVNEPEPGWGVVTAAPLKVTFEIVTPPPTSTFCTSSCGVMATFTLSCAQAGTKAVAAIRKESFRMRGDGLMDYLPWVPRTKVTCPYFSLAS